jgi:hypothetical protein
VIQELNYHKRLLDHAVLNNYSLYKSYRTLKKNENSDVLMNILLQHSMEDIPSAQVLEILRMYLKDPQQQQQR